MGGVITPSSAAIATPALTCKQAKAGFKKQPDHAQLPNKSNQPCGAQRQVLRWNRAREALHRRRDPRAGERRLDHHLLGHQEPWRTWLQARVPCAREGRLLQRLQVCRAALEPLELGPWRT